MPELATAETVEDKCLALVEEMDRIAVSSRLILRTLTDRTVVMAVAADTDEAYRLTEAAVPLTELGRLVGERITQIGTLGRTLDSMCDPAIIPAVR